jgi:molybdopterin molybdotransferase
VLQQYGIYPQLLHLPDDPVISEKEISSCLENYDVLLLSGGVSMGKFDYLPAALNRSGVTEHFHKVLQRPGKPFWFGSVAGGPVVFAFPGNPVSSFMCLHRYFLPWLKQCLGMEEQKIYAVLDADLPFQPELTWFVQVSLQVSASGMLTASPLQGNGSGDLANLLGTSAFMELPAEKTTFNKGEVYPVWPFKPIG